MSTILAGISSGEAWLFSYKEYGFISSLRNIFLVTSNKPRLSDRQTFLLAIYSFIIGSIMDGISVVKVLKRVGVIINSLLGYISS